MELYIKVCFWIGAFCFVVRFCELAGRKEWPYKTEETLGFHIAKMILGLLFTVWAGIVLFGH